MQTRKRYGIDSPRLPMKEHIGEARWETTRKVEYMEQFGCFDIESTSYERDGQDYATMYVNQFCVNSQIIYNRTWKDFIKMMDEITETYGLNPNRRFVVYIHNLSYEFHWFQHYFEWFNVFARKEGEPIRAVTYSGIEFRCSYALTNMSLATLGEVRKYNVKKALGNLDYKKLRFWWTPLTEQELVYTDNDVLVIEEFVKEEIEKNGGISRIPYTKTGYVRAKMKKNCYGKGARKYSEFIHSLNITSPHEYNMLMKAFQGGFTHANAFRVNKVYENVSSKDLTSSYPAVMVAELYPMSTGQLIELTNDNYEDLTVTNCLIFEVTFYNIRGKTYTDHIISESKCQNFRKEGDDYQVDNGRVVWASRLVTTITNVDLEVYKLYYDWDDIEFGDCYAYKAGQLPKPIINTLMELYEDKTKLKDVEGRESEYLSAKEMCNSSYGMMVTKMVTEDVIYLGRWDKLKREIDDALMKYNEERGRFLFYPWGVFITAYARRNVLTTIHKIGIDYIYSDTDSIKFLNGQDYEGVFEEYNRKITAKIRYMLERLGIDPSKANPVDIYGNHHPLGEWSDEGVYKAFKTLGAKRYMLYKIASQKDLEKFAQVCRDYNGEKVRVITTIAGANKLASATWLNKMNNPMDRFSEDLDIPEGLAGRNYAHYIDDLTSDTVEDYLGQVGKWQEESSVAIFPKGYHLSLSKEFVSFLRTLTLEEILDIFEDS